MKRYVPLFEQDWKKYIRDNGYIDTTLNLDSLSLDELRDVKLAFSKQAFIDPRTMSFYSEVLRKISDLSQVEAEKEREANMTDKDRQIKDNKTHNIKYEKENPNYFRVGLKFKNLEDEEFIITETKEKTFMVIDSHKQPRSFKYTRAIYDGTYRLIDNLDIEEVKQMAGTNKAYPLTKSNIGAFLQLSSSKYNPIKKERAIEIAMNILMTKDKEPYVISSGSYTEKNTFGIDYLIDGVTKTIFKGIFATNKIHDAKNVIYDYRKFK